MKRLPRLARLALLSLLLLALTATAGVVYYLATIYTASPAQSGYLALVGATVLVGEDLEPRRGATVLVRDGIIVAAGSHEVDVPAGAVVLDLAGYTLMPGLMDLHVHLGAPELDVGQALGPARVPGYIVDLIRLVPDRRRALLNHGVTAVRSLGDEPAFVLELRQRVRDGELQGPRVYAAGPLFTTRGGHPVVTLGVDPESDAVRIPSTSAEARRAVRDLAERTDRVDVIKVVQERGRPGFVMEAIAPDVLRAIVEEAQAHGLPVTAHWGTRADLIEVIAAGVDGLEHLEPRDIVSGWPPDILEAVVEGGLSITPTLTVLEVALERPGSRLPPGVLREKMALALEFHAAGGRLVVGSDAGMPGVRFGPGVHRELELLVESGLTPRDALKSATSEAARVLGTAQLGAVEAGRAADIVVVDGDPLRDIRAARNVVLVLRDGRVVVDRRLAESRASDRSEVTHVYFTSQEERRDAATYDDVAGRSARDHDAGGLRLDDRSTASAGDVDGGADCGERVRAGGLAHAGVHGHDVRCRDRG